MELMFNSERILIRPIEKDDAESLFGYRSDALTNKYQCWIPKNITEVYEFIDTRIAKSINVFDTWFQLAIIHKDKNLLIGDIGLHFIDEQSKQVEIGCTIDKNFQGKAFATEALERVIDFLFKELNKHRIKASVDPRNIGSIKLMEKLGFRKEAHFKQSIFSNGEWVDDIIYAILKEEWLRSK